MKNTQIYRNLVINGSLTTEELTVGPFTFPSTDGSSGEVLTTDGLGNVTWQSIGSLSLTTDDVAEGTNQYFTNERVDDRVSNLIQDGTGISWTYNDGANTLTGNVSLSSFSTTDLSEGTNQYFTNEKVDDRVSNLIQNGTGISWNYNDSLGTLTPTISLASFSTTDLSEGTNQYFTNEKVDDRVSNLIQDGTGITWLYNDIANTLTPTVSLASFTTDDLSEGAINKYLTDENIDDRVAALVQDTSTVTWTYNDGANTLSADAVSIVEVQDNGSTVASYDTINFIEGSGITLNFTNDALNNRVDVEIVSTGGGGGSGTMNAVASSGVLVGDPDITTLNFLDNFLITESPNQQINIDLSVLLSDISDVSLVSPLLDGDLLRYNSTLGLWENISFDSITTEFSRTTSTGIIEGGVMSINTSGANNTLDISAGNGVVVDSFTDPNNPIITEVSWSSFTNITPSFIASAVGSYILIQPNGTLLELPVTSPPTAIQKRDNIFLGFVGHADNINVINVFNFPMPKAASANQVEELADAIGPFNISGNNIILPGPGLTLDKGSGTSYFYGGNFQNNSKVPSTLNVALLTGPTMIYAKQDAVLGPTSSNVDVAQYDNAGTLTAMPTNQFTNHRIWLDPINDQLVFQYGQNVYGNITDAESAIPTETYISPAILSDVAYVLGVLITQQGTTDLSDPLDATFVPQSKFGGSGGGGAGGGGSNTLQDVYNNSGNPEILTDASRGALTLRRGSAADIDPIYEGQNGAGTTTFALTGNGIITTGTWNGSAITEIYGGTGVTAWAAGEILYADGVNSLAALGAGSAGTYLRSGGIGVPVSWSTASLPNTAATGDLIYASSVNNYDNLSAVAIGSVLLSQGVGVAPSWGAVSEDYLLNLGTGSAGEILSSDGTGGFAWTSAGSGVNPPDVSTYSAATVTLTNIANTYEYHAGFDTTTNSIEVTLPAASAGKVTYHMKDIGCNSETNLIRFVAAGADTIITTITGETSIDLVTNGGAINLTSDGANTWWLS